MRREEGNCGGDGEIDPKEMQNDFFLACYSKIKGDCPSPKQSETVSPELHEAHKRVLGIMMTYKPESFDLYL